MERPNVVLLVMDTARAATVLPAMRDGTLPNLAELAADATTFENAVTVAPWTLPSHASLFTGQYPSTHRTDANSPRFDPDIKPLAERLSESGYRTGGISANPWVSPEFGFDDGFDDYSMKWDAGWNQYDVTAAVNAESTLDGIVEMLKTTPVRRYPALIRSLWHKRFGDQWSDDGAKRITSRASNWVDERSESDAPFFLFLNYLEPHLPYEPPRAFAEEVLTSEEVSRAEEIDQDPWRYIAGEVDHDESEFRILRNLYVAELRYLDSQIGVLLERMKRAGVYDDTAIFVVGDHGENIGDHGLMDHQYCLYDTLINVPLIVKHPRLEAGTIEESPFETRDLYLSILRLASCDVESLPDSVSTESLDTVSRDYTVSEYLTPQPSVESLSERVDTDASLARFDRTYRAIRGRRWKLIESSDGTPSLFDLAEDPDEAMDRSNDRPEIVERLSESLYDRVGDFTVIHDEGPEIDEQSKQRLEELGYLQ